MAAIDDSDNESFKSFKDDDEPAQPSEAKKSTARTLPGTEHGQDFFKKSSTPSASVKQEKEVTSKPPPVERFPPEEEAALLSASNDHKAAGNKQFGAGSFENAIQNYDRALSSCPNYLDFELAVLRSNVAACHLKLNEWKEAIESAGKGIDCLERLEPLPRPKKAAAASDEKDGKSAGASSVEQDGIEEVDDDLAARIENLQKSGHTLDEVRRLQIKLLMRRAKARSEVGGWSALQGAEEDYTILLLPAMQGSITATDRRTVSTALRALSPRLSAARDKGVADMMGKLKGFGNSILGNFGLSTDNFQFVKDGKTGGYSMNFNQNPKKG